MLGYQINLKKLCRNQRFNESQVVSSELVFPQGAVPNAQILWIRVELTSGERKFITVPLAQFYEYIDLPESSIGGWTDGDRGSDYSGLDSRHEIVNPGSGKEVRSELQLGAESTEESVEARVSEPDEAEQSAGV